MAHAQRNDATLRTVTAHNIIRDLVLTKIGLHNFENVDPSFIENIVASVNRHLHSCCEQAIRRDPDGEGLSEDKTSLYTPESDDEELSELTDESMDDVEMSPSPDKILSSNTQPAMYIHEMNDEQYETFTHHITDVVKRHIGTGWDRITAKVNPSHVIEDICYGFRSQQSQRGLAVPATTSWLMQINGDIQRGKTETKAFIALIVHSINKSPKCKNRCCTIVASPMCSWAASLQDGMGEKLQEFELNQLDARNDTVFDVENDSFVRSMTSKSTVHVARLSGSDNGDVSMALRCGGVVVCHRTAACLKKCRKAIEQEQKVATENGEPLVWPVVLLDESDRMLGKCVERDTEMFRYEEALHDLLGWRTTDEGTRVVPPVVAQVSGTNAFCFFHMVSRLGKISETTGELFFKPLDVINFKRPTKDEYVSIDRFIQFNGEYLQDLHPSDEYVNQQVLDVYRDGLSKPCHCVLDCTARGVKAKINMQTHLDAVFTSLDAEDMPYGAVCLFKHGGHSVFEGSIGLRLINPCGHIDSELNNVLRDHIKMLTERKTFVSLQGDLELLQTKVENDFYGKDISISDMLPILRYYEQVAATETGRKKTLVENHQKQIIDQLSLVLSVLKKIFPNVPFVVSGFDMIRRCLSVVGSDFTSSSREPLLAVTHMIMHASANAADVTQMFMRPATTMISFHRKHGIDHIKMLASRKCWESAQAMLSFLDWQHFDPSLTPVERRKTLNEIAKRAGHHLVHLIDIYEYAPYVVSNLKDGNLTESQLENIKKYFTMISRDGRNFNKSELATGIAMSEVLTVPALRRNGAQESAIQPLFTSIRQPFAHGNAGVVEKRVGELFDFLSGAINEMDVEAYFERPTGRRGRPPSMVPSEIKKSIMAFMRYEKIHSEAQGLRHMGIRSGVGDMFPHLRENERYQNLLNLRKTGGIGYQLGQLVRAGHLLRTKRGRSFVYWLPANQHSSM